VAEKRRHVTNVTQEREARKREEDRERGEQEDAEELVLEFKDSLVEAEGVDKDPRRYRRHYYSFHRESAIKIQALQRGRALRKEMAGHKRMAARDFVTVKKLHMEEELAAEAVRVGGPKLVGTGGAPEGGGVGRREEAGGADDAVDDDVRIPLSSVMRQLTKMGWGQPRLHRVRTAMGKMQRRGERSSGGEVGHEGFFRVVLHTYMHEAQARKERGFYLPDEERARQ